MERHGYDSLDSGPKVFLPAEAAQNEIRQGPGKNLKPAVLVKQDEVLDDPFILSPGPVPRERRPARQAICAQMGLAGPVEETSATEAERRIGPLELPEALPADDPFTGLFQENPADLAGGGKKDELPELPPQGKPPPRKEH